MSVPSRIIVFEINENDLLHRTHDTRGSILEYLDKQIHVRDVQPFDELWNENLTKSIFEEETINYIESGTKDKLEEVLPTVQRESRRKHAKKTASVKYNDAIFSRHADFYPATVYGTEDTEHEQTIRLLTLMKKPQYTQDYNDDVTKRMHLLDVAPESRTKRTQIVHMVPPSFINLEKIKQSASAMRERDDADVLRALLALKTRAHTDTNANADLAAHIGARMQHHKQALFRWQQQQAEPPCFRDVEKTANERGRVQLLTNPHKMFADDIDLSTSTETANRLDLNMYSIPDLPHRDLYLHMCENAVVCRSTTPEDSLYDYLRARGLVTKKAQLVDSETAIGNPHKRKIKERTAHMVSKAVHLAKASDTVERVTSILEFDKHKNRLLAVYRTYMLEFFLAAVTYMEILTALFLEMYERNRLQLPYHHEVRLQAAVALYRRLSSNDSSSSADPARSRTFLVPGVDANFAITRLIDTVFEYLFTNDPETGRTNYISLKRTLLNDIPLGHRPDPSTSSVREFGYTLLRLEALFVGYIHHFAFDNTLTRSTNDDVAKSEFFVYCEGCLNGAEKDAYKRTMALFSPQNLLINTTRYKALVHAQYLKAFDMLQDITNHESYAQKLQKEREARDETRRRMLAESHVLEGLTEEQQPQPQQQKQPTEVKKKRKIETTSTKAGSEEGSEAGDEEQGEEEEEGEEEDLFGENEDEEPEREKRKINIALKDLLNTDPANYAEISAYQIAIEAQYDKLLREDIRTHEMESAKLLLEKDIQIVASLVQDLAELEAEKDQIAGKYAFLLGESRNATANYGSNENVAATMAQLALNYENVRGAAWQSLQQIRDDLRQFVQQPSDPPEDALRQVADRINDLSEPQNEEYDDFTWPPDIRRSMATMAALNKEVCAHIEGLYRHRDAVHKALSLLVRQHEKAAEQLVKVANGTRVLSNQPPHFYSHLERLISPLEYRELVENCKNPRGEPLFEKLRKEIDAVTPNILTSPLLYTAYLTAVAQKSGKAVLAIDTTEFVLGDPAYNDAINAPQQALDKIVENFDTRRRMPPYMVCMVPGIMDALLSHATLERARAFNAGGASFDGASAATLRELKTNAKNGHYPAPRCFDTGLALALQDHESLTQRIYTPASANAYLNNQPAVKNFEELFVPLSSMRKGDTDEDDEIIREYDTSNPFDNTDNNHITRMPAYIKSMNEPRFPLGAAGAGADDEYSESTKAIVESLTELSRVLEDEGSGTAGASVFIRQIHEGPLALRKYNWESGTVLANLLKSSLEGTDTETYISAVCGTMLRGGILNSGWLVSHPLNAKILAALGTKGDFCRSNLYPLLWLRYQGSNKSLFFNYRTILTGHDADLADSYVNSAAYKRYVEAHDNVSMRKYIRVAMEEDESILNHRNGLDTVVQKIALKNMHLDYFIGTSVVDGEGKTPLTQYVVPLYDSNLAVMATKTSQRIVIQTKTRTKKTTEPRAMTASFWNKHQWELFFRMTVPELANYIIYKNRLKFLRYSEDKKKAELAAGTPSLPQDEATVRVSADVLRHIEKPRADQLARLREFSDVEKKIGDDIVCTINTQAPTATTLLLFLTHLVLLQKRLGISLDFAVASSSSSHYSNEAIARRMLDYIGRRLRDKIEKRNKVDRTYNSDRLLTNYLEHLQRLKAENRRSSVEIEMEALILLNVLTVNAQNPFSDLIAALGIYQPPALGVDRTASLWEVTKIYYACYTTIATVYAQNAGAISPETTEIPWITGVQCVNYTNYNTLKQSITGHLYTTAHIRHVVEGLRADIQTLNLHAGFLTLPRKLLNANSLAGLQTLQGMVYGSAFVNFPLLNKLVSTVDLTEEQTIRMQENRGKRFSFERLRLTTDNYKGSSLLQQYQENVCLRLFTQTATDSRTVQTIIDKNIAHAKLVGEGRQRTILQRTRPYNHHDHGASVRNFLLQLNMPARAVPLDAFSALLNREMTADLGANAAILGAMEAEKARLERELAQTQDPAMRQGFEHKISAVSTMLDRNRAANTLLDPDFARSLSRSLARTNANKLVTAKTLEGIPVIDETLSRVFWLLQAPCPKNNADFKLISQLGNYFVNMVTQQKLDATGKGTRINDITNLLSIYETDAAKPPAAQLALTAIGLKTRLLMKIIYYIEKLQDRQKTMRKVNDHQKRLLLNTLTMLYLFKPLFFEYDDSAFIEIASTSAPRTAEDVAKRQALVMSLKSQDTSATLFNHEPKALIHKYLRPQCPETYMTHAVPFEGLDKLPLDKRRHVHAANATTMQGIVALLTQMQASLFHGTTFKNMTLREGEKGAVIVESVDVTSVVTGLPTFTNRDDFLHTLLIAPTARKASDVEQASPAQWVNNRHYFRQLRAIYGHKLQNLGYGTAAERAELANLLRGYSVSQGEHTALLALISGSESDKKLSEIVEVLKKMVQNKQLISLSADAHMYINHQSNVQERKTVFSYAEQPLKYFGKRAKSLLPYAIVTLHSAMAAAATKVEVEEYLDHFLLYMLAQIEYELTHITSENALPIIDNTDLRDYMCPLLETLNIAWADLTTGHAAMLSIADAAAQNLEMNPQRLKKVLYPLLVLKGTLLKDLTMQSLQANMLQQMAYMVYHMTFDAWKISLSSPETHHTKFDDTFKFNANGLLYKTADTDIYHNPNSGRLLEQKMPKIMATLFAHAFYEKRYWHNLCNMAAEGEYTSTRLGFWLDVTSMRPREVQNKLIRNNAAFASQPFILTRAGHWFLSFHEGYNTYMEKFYRDTLDTVTNSTSPPRARLLERAFLAPARELFGISTVPQKSAYSTEANDTQSPYSLLRKHREVIKEVMGYNPDTDRLEDYANHEFAPKPHQQHVAIDLTLNACTYISVHPQHTFRSDTLDSVKSVGAATTLKTEHHRVLQYERIYGLPAPLTVAIERKPRTFHIDCTTLFTADNTATLRALTDHDYRALACVARYAIMAHGYAMVTRPSYTDKRELIPSLEPAFDKAKTQLEECIHGENGAKIIPKTVLDDAKYELSFLSQLVVKHLNSEVNFANHDIIVLFLNNLADANKFSLYCNLNPNSDRQGFGADTYVFLVYKLRYFVFKRQMFR